MIVKICENIRHSKDLTPYILHQNRDESRSPFKLTAVQKTAAEELLKKGKMYYFSFSPLSIKT